MFESIIPLVNRTVKVVQQTTTLIFPFCEKPAGVSQNEAHGSTPAKVADNAAELFSAFTADIMRQEVVFTR